MCPCFQGLPGLEHSRSSQASCMVHPNISAGRQHSKRTQRIMTIAIWNEYPRGGHWERNTAHFPTGMSLHLWELFMPAHHQGTQIGFERYGCAIERFDFARFRGRVYTRKCFINDPAELSARSNTAHEAVVSKLWRRDRA